MEWLLLLVGLVLILGTAFFVAVEFSLVALDVPSVKRAVDNGDRKAEPLLRCLRTLSTQLSAVQLGITLTTLLTGYVIEPSLGALLRAPLESLGLGPVSQPISLVVAMVLATLLSMVLGELIPKNLAIADPFRLGRILARPQLMFSAVFKPAVVVLNGFANWILHRFGLEAKEEISGARTPEELTSLINRSALLGTVDQGTARFLSRTLHFSERTASDVMTPRIRMQAVHVNDPLPLVIETARRTGYSRFPVIGDSSDDVLGVAHVKKAVSVPRDRRSELVAANIMSEISQVPETVHLDDLIGELREANLQLAVVLDEYGGTAGIVTLEDLVEEIVGDVTDEHDRTQPGALQTADGRWYLPGLLRPDEVTDQIPGLKVDDESSYETLGGYVMASLGRVPVLGDEVPAHGGTLKVSRMDGKRVDRLQFTPTAQAQAEPGRNEKGASA
ncbi:hemolysin family protein [Galactobacter caseinivorans]|uniref:HlyC/CorC family transporter n=1 Tax=Galactobacter caseinivorans TaxID=2676123 RepID=A0A496PMP5_9MICC|nr:hemolysin family protein [Galactobacter caseinivorans]RKW71812.1 HlyC/CorC family transporter [Galactobacter caseinivorans]